MNKLKQLVLGALVVCLFSSCQGEKKENPVIDPKTGEIKNLPSDPDELQEFIDNLSFHDRFKAGYRLYSVDGDYIRMVKGHFFTFITKDGCQRIIVKDVVRFVGNILDTKNSRFYKKCPGDDDSQFNGNDIRSIFIENKAKGYVEMDTTTSLRPIPGWWSLADVEKWKKANPGKY